MAKYEKYAEYQDSGEDFLPLLPVHWDVSRVKKILNLRRFIVGNQSKFYQLLSLTLKGVIPRDISNGDGKIPESFDTYQAVKLDDLVFCLFDMDETPRTVGIAEQDGMITGAYNVYEVRQDNFPKYIYYYFLYLDQFKGLKPYYTGLRKVVRADTFANIKMPCPSLSEQTQIANFLDYETAQIDTLIAKQEKLIELLKEKRQAVISHAVTKGLNPDINMKDSGVEWLGQVPEHWRVCRLKHVGYIQSGIAKGKDLTGKKSISVPMLRVANVQDGYLNLDEVHQIEIEPEQLERYLLQDGDVLMNEGGDNDKLGRGAVWRSEVENCIHQNHVFAIRTTEIESEWLDILTRASYAKFHFFRQSKQSTNLASISATNIKETPILVPPKQERELILKFLHEQFDRFSKLEDGCYQQVELLKERRKALISSAVTGKIDVRNWHNPNHNNNEANTELGA